MVEISLSTLLGILATIVFSLIGIALVFIYRISVNLEGLSSVQDDTQSMIRLLHEMTGRVDNLPEFESDEEAIDDPNETDSEFQDEAIGDAEEDSEEDDDEENSNNTRRTTMVRREDESEPDAIAGVTRRISTGYGKVHITINEDPETGSPIEMLIHIGQSGGFTNSFTEALSQAVTIALKAGADVDDIIEAFDGIRSPKVAWDEGEQVQSIPDAVALALQRHTEENASSDWDVFDDSQNDSPTDGI